VVAVGFWQAAESRHPKVAPEWPLTPDRRSVVDAMVASLIYPIGHDDIEDEDIRT